MLFVEYIQIWQEKILWMRDKDVPILLSYVFISRGYTVPVTGLAFANGFRLTRNAEIGLN